MRDTSFVYLILEAPVTPGVCWRMRSLECRLEKWRESQDEN